MPFKGKKISTFVGCLEQGHSKEAAQKASGVSDATATTQYAKWNKGKQGAKTPKVEKNNTPKSEVTATSDEVTYEQE